MLRIEEIAAAEEAADARMAWARRHQRADLFAECQAQVERAAGLRSRWEAQEAALAARAEAEKTPAAVALARAAVRDLNASGSALRAALDALQAAVGAVVQAAGEHAATVRRHAAALEEAGLGLTVAGVEGAAPITLGGGGAAGSAPLVRAGGHWWRTPSAASLVEAHVGLGVQAALGERAAGARYGTALRALGRVDDGLTAALVSAPKRSRAS